MNEGVMKTAEPFGDIRGDNVVPVNAPDTVLSAQELNTLLPQVFTRAGKIRKDTRNPMRGLGAIVPALKLAERCRTEDAANKNGHIIIFCACGHIHMGDELSDHIRATDLFAALASRGWVLLAGK